MLVRTNVFSNEPSVTAMTSGVDALTVASRLVSSPPVTSAALYLFSPGIEMWRARESDSVRSPAR